MFKKVPKDGDGMTRQWKLVTSGVIYYCTFTLGLAPGLLGPSLLDLSKIFQTDISSVSKVFTISMFSILIGATVCGIAFNYVNRQLASALLLLVMGVCTILTPHLPSLPFFFGVVAIGSFVMGGYVTAQIVWIIEMWERKAAVYIQIQHFSFAVGNFVAPLVLKLFLSSEPEGRVNYAAGDEPKEGSSVLFVPFLLGGVATLIGGGLLMLLYSIKKYELPRKAEEPDSGKIGTGSEFSVTGSDSSRKILLVLFSALILGACQAMEMSAFQFLPTFTHFIDLHLLPPDGALVASGLAAAYTLGRGIGIFIALSVLPEILLLSNVVLVLIGNTILLLLANDSLPVLWGGSILLGLGFSTLTPSFYGFIERHLKVSNVVGSVMVVTGGLISSFYPIVIGGFIQGNPFVLMYMTYLSLGLSTTIFIIVYAMTRKRRGENGSYSSLSTENGKKGAGKGHEVTPESPFTTDQ